MAANLQAGLWRWQHARAGEAQPDLEPIGFSGIAGWAEDDHCAALDCYLQSASLTGMPAPDAASAEALLKDRQKARAFFEEAFAAFRIKAAPGLLTSYFEPVLKGSRQEIGCVSDTALPQAAGFVASAAWASAERPGAYRRPGNRKRLRALLHARGNRGRGPGGQGAGNSVSWRTLWKPSSCTFKAPG